MKMESVIKVKRVDVINPILLVVNRASIQFLFTGKFLFVCLFVCLFFSIGKNLLLANPLINNFAIKVLFPVKFVMRIFLL